MTPNRSDRRHGTGSHGGSRSDRSPRRQLTLVEWGVLVAIVAALAVATLAVSGNTEVEASELGTVVVRVRATQTLWEIASANPIPGRSTAQTVEVIKAINELESSQLRADQLLEVPHASLEVALASR